MAFFSDGIKVSLADSTVVKNGYLHRKGNFVVFQPVWKEENCLVAFNEREENKSIAIPDSWGEIKQVAVFLITGEGEVLLKNIPVDDNKFLLKMTAGKPYSIKPKNK